MATRRGTDWGLVASAANNLPFRWLDSQDGKLGRLRLCSGLTGRTSCRRQTYLSWGHGEIFFRFFKHMLGCRHLLSHDQNGIEIQTYCAIIACLLIALWTNKKPTLRKYEMICFYFIGLADEEELMAHIEKLKRQDA